MSSLEKIIKSQIMQSGAMDVGAFMALALGHAEHGYYMKQDPFGRGGDFVTAPEVSQMFGEMIGAWCAQTWMQMGSPERFVLLECGPGRGTLMADALRATKNVSGFHHAMGVHLVEISPVLKARQCEALKGYDVEWYESLDNVPDDCPIIVVANEFFDALPFRQLVYTDGVWRERVVGEESGQLVLGLRDCPKAFWPKFGVPKEGNVYEFAPVRESVMDVLLDRIKAHGGAGLFIDYGHAKSAFGDTFQAVYQHEYCNVLDHIGDADLTSHVDFEALGRIAGETGVQVDGVVEQGAFLQMLGIGVRAQALGQAAPDKAKDIQNDLQRLVNSDQMGSLFKVMGVRYGFDQKLAGF